MQSILMQPRACILPLKLVKPKHEHDSTHLRCRKTSEYFPGREFSPWAILRKLWKFEEHLEPCRGRGGREIREDDGKFTSGRTFLAHR